MAIFMPGYSKTDNKYPITGRKEAEIYALKDERNQMIKEGRLGDTVDDVLLKIIELLVEPLEKKKRGGML